MSESFEEDDLLFEDEWAEISDMHGHKALFRHLGTIHNKEKTYHVLGAVKENKPDERALMLIREEETADGALQHVIVNSEHEIQMVIGQFVMRVLTEHLREEAAFDDMDIDPCGHRHLPGEFCYCDDPEFLQ